jgi:uncharacterized protein (DUF2164 family)
MNRKELYERLKKHFTERQIEALKALAAYSFNQGIRATVKHFNETKFDVDGELLLINHMKGLE